jgi:hypothetical protein
VPTQAPIVPTQAPIVPTQGSLVPTESAFVPTHVRLVPTGSCSVPTRSLLEPSLGDALSSISMKIWLWPLHPLRRYKFCLFFWPKYFIYSLLEPATAFQKRAKL